MEGGGKCLKNGNCQSVCAPKIAQSSPTTEPDNSVARCYVLSAIGEALTQQCVSTTRPLAHFSDFFCSPVFCASFTLVSFSLLLTARAAGSAWRKRSHLRRDLRQGSRCNELIHAHASVGNAAPSRPGGVFTECSYTQAASGPEPWFSANKPVISMEIKVVAHEQLFIH